MSTKFDQLFSTITGYDQLDERIRKTKENKEHLLKVLVLPEVPLHNNAAELATRAKVRKRDQRKKLNELKERFPLILKRIPTVQSSLSCSL